MIYDELPKLAGYLMCFELPENLRDSRSGVKAWRHPDLTQAIESTKPESRLEELLQTACTSHLWQDLSRALTASEIEGRLVDKDSPVRDQVKQVLGTWTMACGTYLGRLADGGSETVQPADCDTHRKVRRFYIRRPICG